MRSLNNTKNLATAEVRAVSMKERAATCGAMRWLVYVSFRKEHPHNTNAFKNEELPVFFTILT